MNNNLTNATRVHVVPLVDDMSVIEAPSMIVPYLCMKRSTIPFAEFVCSLGIQLKHENYMREQELKKNNTTIIDLDDDSDDSSDSSVNTGFSSQNNNSYCQMNNNLHLTTDQILNVDEDDRLYTPVNKFLMNIGLDLATDYVKNATINSKKRKSILVRKTKKINTDTLLYCGFCNFKTDSIIVLINHMETPHAKKLFYRVSFCSMQNEVFTIKNEVFYLSTNLLDSNKFLCSYCPAGFNVKSRIMRHLPTCYKNFKVNLNLASLEIWDSPAKQMMQKMPFEQLIMCEICDGLVRSKQSLYEHMRLVHKVKIFSMDKCKQPFMCHKCPKRFYSGRGMERHLLVAHLLVTEYWKDAEINMKDRGVCSRCNSFQSQLLQHLRKRHDLTLKPVQLTFRCVLCSTAYSKFDAYEKHVSYAHNCKTRY